MKHHADVLNQLRHADGVAARLLLMDDGLISIKQTLASAADEIERLRKDKKDLRRRYKDLEVKYNDLKASNGIEEYKYESVDVISIKPGDVVNINTGYRPLDDEDVPITKSYATKGLFGDDTWVLEGVAYTGPVYLNCAIGDKVSKRICLSKK